MTHPHAARKTSGTRSVLALLLGVASLVAAGVTLPSRAEAVASGWQVTGPGSTLVSSGGASSPAFRYETKSEGKWTFLTTAVRTEQVTLPWAWSGDHGTQKRTRYLSVVIDRNGDRAFEFERKLEGSETQTATGPTSFKLAGTTQLEVRAGDSYGFRVTGSNRDSAGAVRGTLLLPAAPTVTVPAQPVTATATDGSGAVVGFAASVSATDEADGTLPVSCTPASGSRFAIGDTQVVCSATSSSQQTTSRPFVVRVYPGQTNVVWPKAELMGGTDQRTGTLHSLDQALWYRFPVQPDGNVEVGLTGLTADYDLTVFGDIGAAFDEALTPDDLNQLTAEFAADAYSPSAFSPSAFSPSAFSPSAFSPSAFSPSAFSPSAFSPSAFSPSAFSPSAFSPSAFSPSAFSPSAFSPAVSLPSAFSPSAFSPSAFSEAELRDAFSSAQLRTLIAVSARDGLADEHVRVNTWSATGFFYVRVQGRNGASSPDAFTLRTASTGGACSAPLQDFSSVETFRGVPGGARTVILTDSARMSGAPLAALSAFAGRPEIGGVVIDAATIPRLRSLNEQADRLDGVPLRQEPGRPGAARDRQQPPRRERPAAVRRHRR